MQSTPTTNKLTTTIVFWIFVCVMTPLYLGDSWPRRNTSMTTTITIRALYNMYVMVLRCGYYHNVCFMLQYPYPELPFKVYVDPCRTGSPMCPRHDLHPETRTWLPTEDNRRAWCGRGARTVFPVLQDWLRVPQQQPSRFPWFPREPPCIEMYVHNDDLYKSSANRYERDGNTNSIHLRLTITNLFCNDLCNTEKMSVPNWSGSSHLICNRLADFKVDPILVQHRVLWVPDLSLCVFQHSQDARCDREQSRPMLRWSAVGAPINLLECFVTTPRLSPVDSNTCVYTTVETTLHWSCRFDHVGRPPCDHVIILMPECFLMRIHCPIRILKLYCMYDSSSQGIDAVYFSTEIIYLLSWLSPTRVMLSHSFNFMTSSIPVIHDVLRLLDLISCVFQHGWDAWRDGELSGPMSMRSVGGIQTIRRVDCSSTPYLTLADATTFFIAEPTLHWLRRLDLARRLRCDYVTDMMCEYLSTRRHNPIYILKCRYMSDSSSMSSDVLNFVKHKITSSVDDCCYLTDKWSEFYEEYNVQCVPALYVHEYIEDTLSRTLCLYITVPVSELGSYIQPVSHTVSIYSSFVYDSILLGSPHVYFRTVSQVHSQTNSLLGPTTNYTRGTTIGVSQHFTPTTFQFRVLHTLLVVLWFNDSNERGRCVCLIQCLTHFPRRTKTTFTTYIFRILRPTRTALCCSSSLVMLTVLMINMSINDYAIIHTRICQKTNYVFQSGT